MKLLKFFEIAVAVMAICMMAMPVVALDTPTGIFGYVKLDGSPVSGATVTLSDGQTATTDSHGHYDFGSGVNNGSHCKATATYEGKSASTSFTAYGPKMQIDIAITSSAPSHTGDTGSHGSEPTHTAEVNETSHGTPAEEHNATTDEHSVDEHGTDHGEVSSHEGASEGEHGEEHAGEHAAAHDFGNHDPYQLLTGLAVLAGIAGIGYYVLLRER